MAVDEDFVTRARRDLLEVLGAALARVEGRSAVTAWLRAHGSPAVAAVAIGKAADAMLRGAFEALDGQLREALLITKHGHLDRRYWRGLPVSCHEAGHPVPDAGSLAAGRALLEFLSRQPPRAPLLFLISGGASALVEVPAPGVSLEALQRANDWLLASGLPIDALNRVRRGLSAIKAGGLLAYLGDRPLQGLLISDVPGDDPAVIGSGLLVPAPPGPLPGGLPDWLRGLLRAPAEPPSRGTPPLHLVATLGDALQAATSRAAALGWAAHPHEAFLAGEAADRGRALARTLLAGPPGLHLWGGETTVRLPPHPGRGGRNQQLALAAAEVLDGHPRAVLLAVGTDGTDGPTEDAGGLVDGDTLERARAEGLDPADHLARADAGTLLEATGDLVHTGPTGTNVMDLVLGALGPGGRVTP